MDLTFSDDELAFRDELRAWLAANPLPDPPKGSDTSTFAWRRDCQRMLHKGGWVAPHWPKEYGGRDATLLQSAIYYDEVDRAQRKYFYTQSVVGLVLAGPTILQWGTDEQKERFLPPLLSGDELWCQGFSEPDAGSDLASLRTHATQHGDEWHITGQKVWTSFAHLSKWCMLLARTDLDAPKHKGLTYFLMDMEQPGVQIEPLRQITGEAEFNEVFLDNAVVLDEHRLGPVGAGWKVTMTTLMHERAGLGVVLQGRLKTLIDELHEEARNNGAIDDPRIADEIGELLIRCEAGRLMSWKGLTDTERYGQPGPEGSLVKWLWAETNQRVTQLAIDVVGPQALTQDSPWCNELLRTRANTIEGGTTEIQKNIVAERVLGLPRLQ